MGRLSLSSHSTQYSRCVFPLGVVVLAAEFEQCALRSCVLSHSSCDILYSFCVKTVIESYYHNITMARFSTLLDLSEDEAEKRLSDEVRSAVVPSSTQLLPASLYDRIREK